MQVKNTASPLFSSRLVQAMNVNHLTQKDLEEMTKIRQTSISEYKNGKTIPSADALMRLANALGVTMDWLYGRTEAPHTTCEQEDLRHENHLLRDRLKTLGTAIRAVLDKYEC